MPNFPSVADEVISNLAAPCPKILWIELTSKCPFDCTFCSRKFERGDGRHMDYPLYESLISQLRRPELIRLNYSGESTHYPRLSDAIGLARSTGAITELVSALASAPPPVLQALVDGGLHRLSVSLHSLDAAQFRKIYGFRDITDLRRNLDYLEQYKTERGSIYPEIDFAFVAMDGNLSQLIPVVEYGRALGVKHVSVHPVIRRSAIPIQFPNELDEDGQLRSAFAARVQSEVEKAAARAPGVSIAIARPGPGRNHPVSKLAGAGITTCEQNPWDTVHVLASGAVVVCEVQDHHAMGNLQQQSLADIWNGPAYADFRRRYSNGGNPACMTCPWRSVVQARAGESVTIRGWYPSVGETVRWSEADAALAVTVQPGVSAIRIAGLLPPAPDGHAPNRLTIRHGEGASVPVVNRTRDLLPFEAVVSIEPPRDVRPEVLGFETRHRFCPAERGQGPDLRKLGFALAGLTMEYDEARKKPVARLLRLLGQAERLGGQPILRNAVLRGVPRWHGPRPAARAESGVSVLLPARDTPDLLPATLTAARAAMEHVSEPTELIVMVTGAEVPPYTLLRRAFPDARWIFRRKALSYGAAVEFGLARARYPWAYLLNSDMILDPRALVELLGLRRFDTFAIGSRIRMRDGSNLETNWTDLRYRERDAAELIERDAGDAVGARGCLYVGGGSGLFRRSLLRRFARRTRAYAPFYWEDVEWGALAWRSGYQCVFCPSSEAIHGRRQTIARYYSEPEISRIFERNRLLFHLRNLGGLERLEERLLSLDPRSWTDVFNPRTLLDTFRTRAGAWMAPRGEDILLNRWKLSF